MSPQLKGLYAITDTALTPDHTVYDQVKEALESGVRIIQYRNKIDDDASIKEVCESLQRLCREYGAIFIIDDRPELAQAIKADGLHIGKDDMSLEEARSRFDGLIGVSCYGSIKKAKEAQMEGADYVAFGSFFASPTKPHSGIVKLSVLQKAKETLDIPVCAIGGINKDNIGDIAAYHPDMISVVSAAFDGNITQNITQLNKGMQL